MKASALLLLVALLPNVNSITLAQEVFSGDTLTVRFDRWAGLGFAPEIADGMLDSRSWIVSGLSDGAMDFGETRLGGDFGRGVSTGRVITGGVYAFAPAADVRLLGFQPTGTDLAPGSAILKIQRGNSLTASAVGVSYDMWYYNDQGRSTLIELEWSTDGVNFVASNGGGFMTPAAAEVGVAWTKQTASASLPTGVAGGSGTLYIRWLMRDGSGTGSRDEWGLEEIRVYIVEDNDDDDDTTPPEPPPYAEKPTVQARNIELIARSDTSMRVTWERGNGDYSILAALPDGVTRCETDTSATYNAHPNIHVAGLTKNGCRVLWSGSEDQAIVLGLKPLEHIMLTALEFNGEGGRENYLEDAQEVVIFQTRAPSPPPIESFRAQLVTFDEVIFTWATPLAGSVKVLVADQIPSTSDILHYIDGEKTSVGIDDSGCMAAPCTISRDLVGSRYVIAFAIDGPVGLQSVQKQPVAVWEADWPDPNKGRLLGEWDFDLESSSPSYSVWEHQNVAITVVGARDRGYATGRTGKASYADQWHAPHLEKAWMLTLTTHGLSLAYIELRVISSASGPAKFQVICEAQNQMYTSSKIVEAASVWATSTIQSVELPAPCLNQSLVKLLITPLEDVALNGNSISRSGTSRLDDVKLYGNYFDGSLPLMGDPQLSDNSDAGVSLTGKWISAIGKWPSRQSLILESKGNVEEKFYPVSDLIDEFRLLGLEPATQYRTSHCGFVGEAYACSRPVEFATPYEPPAMPVITHHRIIAPDSLEVHVASSGFDVVVYAPLGSVQPQLSDSTGLEQLDGTEFRYNSRSSGHRPFLIGGLRPGSRYRFWAIAVAGPDSLARYSRPDHPYLDIAIPRLAEPVMPDLDMTVQQKSMNSVAISVSEPDTSLLLFAVTPYGIEPKRPEDDVFYRHGNQYSQGDRIGEATYVLADAEDRILTINGLPLGQKWLLRVYAFNALNGSITYSSSFAEITFETLPDPVLKPMTADEVWNVASGDTIATTGTVLWLNDPVMLVQLNGGNLLLGDPQGRLSPQTLPQEIALVAAKNESGYEIIDFRLMGEPTQITTQPHIVHPDSSNISIQRHARVTIGNVLKTNSTCQDGSKMYRQRGRLPRSICVIGSQPSDDSGTLEQEWAITGFPLYDPSASQLDIVVASTSDITIYSPPEPVLLSPNKDQLISWTRNDDPDVEFKWKINPALRPYDQYPDSVAMVAYFLTRGVDWAVVNMMKLDPGEGSRSFRASELHRTHSGSDSLQLTVELDWTVGLTRSVDHAESLVATDRWVSIRLLRLKALYDTDVMETPDSFMLEPARPNPFNPSTSLRVHVPTVGRLEIVVYDILGRRVSTLHNGVMMPGVFDFEWDAARLPSGIYIFRAAFGNHYLTQPVTLLK